jgi:hypothetical protein
MLDEPEQLVSARGVVVVSLSVAGLGRRACCRWKCGLGLVENLADSRFAVHVWSAAKWPNECKPCDGG